jgi:hypothetical protein
MQRRLRVRIYFPAGEYPYMKSEHERFSSFDLNGVDRLEVFSDGHDSILKMLPPPL